MAPTLVGLRGRLPVVRQNDRQTDATLLVDVRVVDLGLEVDFRRLERVLGREVDLNSKRSLVVRRVILWRERRTRTEREASG